MKVFTHSEYIEYIHSLRLHAVLELAEESSEYRLKNKENNVKTHDRLLKSILKDDVEIAKFINKFVTDELNIMPNDLIKFTNSYITKRYMSKEADLVYKLKGQDIFFLIEYQSTVDFNMPNRMLNYCIDIMYEWCKSKDFKPVDEYPLIVPIVVYTGNRRWTVPQNFGDKQMKKDILKKYKINFNYNLVDINKISDETFLKQKSMFGYGMLIEKTKDRNELVEKLHQIIKVCNNKKHLEELKNIVLYAINDSFSYAEQEEILEKIERKVGEKNMSTLVERLAAENRRMINQGKREGIKAQKTNVIKRMLAMKFKDNIILEVSGATQEELEKIKKNSKIASNT